MRLHGPAPLGETVLSVYVCLLLIILHPIGVPHSSSEDDVYNGFFIPKGSFQRLDFLFIFFYLIGRFDHHVQSVVPTHINPSS
jgi:hypothetical protein